MKVLNTPENRQMLRQLKKDVHEVRAEALTYLNLSHIEKISAVICLVKAGYKDRAFRVLDGVEKPEEAIEAVLENFYVSSTYRGPLTDCLWALRGVRNPEEGWNNWK